MELSNNLLKEFAAITNDKEKPNESTTYGIVNILDGQVYVIFDGASAPTPVESLVQVKNGDRVLVRIKNHVASIMTWEWRREGAFSLINLRNRASQEIRSDYTISDIDNGGDTTTFRIVSSDSQPLYDLDLIIFTNTRVYFTQVEYNSEKDSIEPVGEMLNAKISSYTYDDSGEHDYYSVTLDTKLPDLTTDYHVCFTVWNVEVFTDIRDGLITVDGEHEDTWVGDGSGRKSTRYLSIGVDSLNYLDPTTCSDEHIDYEGSTPQSVKGYDPEIEPYGYADLELTGDTFRTYGVASIVEYDDNVGDYVETLSDEAEAYVTPYARVYPGGAIFGMKGVEPIDPSELPEDVESIDHPAYNEVEIKSGYVEMEDAITFKRHVRQTLDWENVEDDPTYNREYFKNPEELNSVQKYSPVWPYKPGDSIVISGPTYLAGELTNSKARFHITIPLNKPISEYVKSITVNTFTGYAKQNNKYLIGSANGAGNFKSGTSITTYIRQNVGIGLVINKSSGSWSDGINNDPVSFGVSNLNITFN